MVLVSEIARMCSREDESSEMRMGNDSSFLGKLGCGVARMRA